MTAARQRVICDLRDRIASMEGVCRHSKALVTSLSSEMFWCGNNNMSLNEFVNVIKNEGGRAATQEEIAAFEVKMASPLPLELKQFLMLSGGGLMFFPPIVYSDSEEDIYSLDA